MSGAMDWHMEDWRKFRQRLCAKIMIACCVVVLMSLYPRMLVKAAVKDLALSAKNVRFLVKNRGQPT